MSFLVRCPNCGDRSVYEFRLGGEIKQRPALDAPESQCLDYRYDLANVACVQSLDFMMPVGWYYKVFHKRAVWHKVEPYIRRIAGLGTIDANRPAEYEHAWMHAATAVIGGGFAGIQAALEAATSGDAVVLID